MISKTISVLSLKASYYILFVEGYSRADQNNYPSPQLLSLTITLSMSCHSIILVNCHLSRKCTRTNCQRQQKTANRLDCWHICFLVCFFEECGQSSFPQHKHQSGVNLLLNECYYRNVRGKLICICAACQEGLQTRNKNYKNKWKR